MNWLQKRVESSRKWFENTKKNSESIVWFFGVLTAIVLSLFILLGPRITQTAKEAVLSPETLREISSRIRPYATINARVNGEGTFVHDAGASAVIDAVSLRRGQSQVEAVLILKLKKYVPAPPLVRPLTPVIYVHSFWRTNKFDWAYEIRSSHTTDIQNGLPVGVWYNMPDDADFMFLVELLN